MTRSAADACWSTVPELRGTHVALEPLSMAHVPALRRALGEGELSRLWYAIDAGVPRLNIGYTWYQRRVQRTGLNTEAKLLLLRHAFEAMGCIGVGFETSWFNQASRAAIARLGARQDGVLRNHRRHADGTPRDTVVFSIIDSEWPAVRRHLQSLLDSHS